MIKNIGSNQQIDAPGADPQSGSSLVPMLVGGLVMIVIGMIAALVFA